MLGRTISHYRLLSQLGSGGMGVVYEAEDTRLGRHVAIKVLPPDAAADAQALDRFLREARIISTLNHPHICTLHDIGDHDGQQFMVMELLEGEPLKERIARGALPLDDVLDLGVQIADALDAAHAAGVIHRDIKPANLFVTRRGQAKVLDFGVAKLAETGAPDRPDLERTLAVSDKTTAGSAVGTVAYMSPEQARGQEIDARSDLFSFGDVLYEMATGQAAFAGPTPAVIFEGILTRQPLPASQVNANMPAELDRIIAKALEKDRETRYQSAAELRADLRRLKRDTETGRLPGMVTGTVPAAAPRDAGTAPALRPAAATVTPTPAAPPSRRRMVLVAAPVVTAIAIAAAVLWQSQRTPALGARDTVVLADFRNRTGDTMFDDTLSEALAVQLRQSPFLNLLTEQQIQMTLRQMNRDAMSPLTPETASEVCQRAGARAMLGGTIGNIGNSYVITLAAQDCVNGSILAEEQVSAAGKDNVITALGSVASTFREKLGESLASVQRYDQNIEQATTRSLEALKAYSQGMTTRRTQGDFDSLPFFRRAVEIDSEFALAHARLGTVLSNLGQGDEARASATRAYDLREKVSERERLYIEARYHSVVTRNTDGAIEAYRLLLATYPDDYAAQSNLGSLYRATNRHKEAIQHLEEAVRLGPTQPLGHLNLGYVYADVSRFADARREFEAVLELQEHMGARAALVTLGTVTGDQALVDAQVAAAKGHRAEVEMFATRAAAAAYKGQLKESARLGDEVFRLLREQNQVRLGIEGLLTLALNQAVAGREDEARRQAARVLAAVGPDEGATDELVALAGVLGDRAMAMANLERATARLKANAPPDAVPKIERAMRAFAAYAQGNYQEAYDLGVAPGADINQAGAMTFTGMAALRVQRYDDAAQLFDKVLEFGPRLGLSSRQGMLRIMLARAHAGAGRTAQARAAYEAAFELWKDADPDLPLLVEARREYQRLGS